MHLRLREKKISWLLIVLTLILEAVFVVNMLKGSEMIFPCVLAGIVFIVFLQFFYIDIAIDQECVWLVKGIGLISRQESISDIGRLEISTNKYLSSWLYSPGQTHILVAHLKDGKRLVLPVKEPRRVADLLNAKNY